jgi:hypothetical protein
MKDDACQIYLVSMVRNEADLFPAFLDRATALFDKLFIVDHQSTDGTRSMLERFATECEKIKIFNFRYQGYYQSEISNCLARHAFGQGADWVFFLDADEFIDIDDRQSLEALVKTFPHEVMHLPWMNLVPTERGSFTGFDASQAFHWDGRLSRYGKVALSATFAANHPHFFLHQGNHAISRSSSHAPAHAQQGCPLLHVPIRSLNRLRYKLAAGMRAYEAKAGRNPIDGFHWFELHDRLERGTAAADWVNGVIANYGEPLSGIEPVNLADKEWTLKHIKGAAESNLAFSATSLGNTVDADARQAWTQLVTVKGAILRAEICNQDVILRPQPVCADGEFYDGGFASLPSGIGELPASFDDNQIAEAISRAFLPIKTVVPSAWTDHTPFLFALFNLIRPRRYVEIGTHHGMSFFAACQAADQLGGGTQCIAVDGWIGDEHAGFYETAVFEEFKAKLQSGHPRNSYYIRTFFEQARSCFAEGSIDLLHIDGLHTYEAVKKDYENWLPNMSSRGVIIFHDTNVYEHNFGVWRLWNELTRKHPHFHLPHCHGLGVIYVGIEPSPVAEFLRRLEQDERLRMVTISILAGLGAMSRKKSTLEHELSSALSEKEVLATEVEQLRTTLGAVWTTTSWRLSRPVRIVGDVLKYLRRSIRRGRVAGGITDGPHLRSGLRSSGRHSGAGSRHSRLSLRVSGRRLKQLDDPE